jgi:hypothetical protein
LTPRQSRTLLIAISVAVAVTRLAAAAHSLWDWDEVLFCHGLRHFDVAAHHPHPPGFPLYILLGKLVRLVVADDFRALRAINLIASMLLFPGVYALARAMRMEFVPSIVAGLLTAFAPNVWFYGGTALSDVPTAVVLFFACALLLRGRYWAGSLLMAAACVMRPQNALIGAWPWLAASWTQWRAGRKREPLLALAAMAAIGALFFGAAAWLTGVAAYRNALALHSKYLMVIDSYRNPDREHWWTLIVPFLAGPLGPKAIALPLSLLALLGVARHRRPALEALATFGPFVLFALFMLNVPSAGRYAVTWMPLIAICAAEGIALVVACCLLLVARAVSRKARPVPRILPSNQQPATSNNLLQSAITIAIIAALIAWTRPALREVRKHDAPTVEACRWIRRHVDPKTATLYVHLGMAPWSDYYLADYQQVQYGNDFSAARVADATNAWALHESVTAAMSGINFKRPRGHLYEIARKRFFEISVVPLASEVTFLDGWHGEEYGDGTTWWRWMGGRARLRLPPLRGNGELTLRFNTPLDVLPRKPVVTLTMNGKVVDRFAAEMENEKRWIIPSATGAPNELTIELDEFVNPAARHISDDARDLGLQLTGYAWVQR